MVMMIVPSINEVLLKGFNKGAHSTFASECSNYDVSDFADITVWPTD